MELNAQPMEIIAQPSNTDKLIGMMRSQMNIQEEITSSDHEVIAFIAQNQNIMEQVEKMEAYFLASQELEAVMKITREQFITQLIDYYLQHNAADDFFSSEYKNFIIK